jgi:hypothetical protein
MPYDAYPTGADLQEYLSEAGITKDSSDLEGRALAGRNLVERKCGRRFLAETVAQVYTFSPPEGSSVLRLPDFAAITSIAYFPTGGTSTAWASGTDYTLERDNDGIALGDVTPPYSRLVLLAGVYSIPLSVYHRVAIRITGRQGYADTLPEDVWEAMCAVGAGLALGVVSVSEGGGLKRLTRADVTEDYGSKGRYSEIADTSMSLFGMVVGLYKRHSL